MRPVRRAASPRTSDFENYRDAHPELVSRLGRYCSFCERPIVTMLAVEHIQPKGLPQYAALVGRWENFLLACVNCNSTKSDKDVVLSELLLPDRDNTFAAFEYGQDGKVAAAASLTPASAAHATATLALVGLDKRGSGITDENGKLVAIDRVAQRMEAWALAQEAKRDVDANPGVPAVRALAIKLAAGTGFFSVWMTVFAGDADIRNRLIDAFHGTRQSGCFEPGTTTPVSPGPNLDRLPHGGKDRLLHGRKA